MSDTATTTRTDVTGDDADLDEGRDDATTTDGDKDWKAEHAKVLAESRKWEERAKQNRAAAAELRKLREAGMSADEKAISEAREAGKAEALAATARRLVTAEVRAAVAGRKGIDVDALVDGIDPTRFVGDDGEPDTKRIADWVNRIAPQGGADLGQGRRGTPKKADMNALIRERMRR